MEQNTMVEKMMKKDQIIPSHKGHYMLNPCCMLLELILWHKYKTREKSRKRTFSH